MTLQNLHHLGVVEVAQAVCDGELRAEDVAAAALTRLEQVGLRYNAVARTDRDGAMRAARALDLKRKQGKTLGLLAGVPLAHKELIYRRGRLAACGSLLLKNQVPAVTATVLERLDGADALDLGSLRMAEFAMSPTGLNVHEGHGRNPWNIEYCPGGSSSGSGSAVAARLVAASLGSDTGGSIRHPASMCGVTGLKPTNGLVSAYGSMPLAPSLDCLGPLARSARDAARLLTVIAGEDAHDASTLGIQVTDYEQFLCGDARHLRIAVPTSYYRESINPEIKTLLDQSLHVLEAAGATILHTNSPDMEPVNACMQVVLACEAASYHKDSLEARAQDYGKQVRSRILPGLSYPATAYLQAQMMRARLTREWIDMAIGDADLVHLPTLAVPVPRIEQSEGGTVEQQDAVVSSVTHCTRGINFLGLPAIAVPCGFTQAGLPVSFQLVARPYAEAILLRTADAYQRLTDFHARLPPDCD